MNQEQYDRIVAETLGQLAKVAPRPDVDLERVTEQLERMTKLVDSLRRESDGRLELAQQWRNLYMDLKAATTALVAPNTTSGATSIEATITEGVSE